MATINLQFNSLSQVFTYTENTYVRSLTGRAYIGEVLMAKIHEEISRQTSECIKREFEKTSGVHTSSCKPTKKCVMKMEDRKKKNDCCIKILW